MASDRGRFAKAIASLEPELDADEGTRLRRVVMELARRLTVALRHGDTYAVMGSLIRNEDDLIEKYRAVLTELDNDAIAREVREQYRLVKGSRVELTSLREDCRVDSLYQRSETSV